MKTNLFSEFDAVSAKAFKQKIQFDLKGADYNETLVWQSLEGIHVKPFYHSDEIKETVAVQAPQQWFIGEKIFIVDAAKSAQTANKAIENGAEAIYFQADTLFDLELLFESLKHKGIPLYFELSFLDEDFYKRFHAFAKAYHITTKLDIINHLALDGNWYHNLQKDHDIVSSLLQGEESKLTVDTTLYQNAGATMVQQLAYGIAHLTEYLNHCEKEKLSINLVTFEVAVGTNYFFEIAKLRALRKLAAVVLSAFNYTDVVINIIAHPSRRNKTIYDYNINMLRTTTECMSAVLGGADWVVNMPYDALYHKTNNFGQRISRNQLIVLKEESYFDVVQNPADGSYYVEELTSQLAEKALTLYKDIEAQGGFLRQLKEGTIQRKIKESAAKEQAKFDEGELILLGTNKHPNPKDVMKGELEIYPFVKINPRKTLLEPIIAKRLAEALEQERIKAEK
ncbi:methylmalonyl-CoA mutase subunit beta [uncultured Dokdonia sp.]|uniref:methylmalonyl-CoA mutase subunit beta n=1 Tax=uncultured Dokdonia sp. TaxID=575653 RepID=UPI0030EE7B1E|tara:strand:+ start:248810 stop:250168 length:1359 start_codon:yes stop_codon:yes gene_type:complete